MENFREKLKMQNILIAVCCFVLAIFSLLSALGEAGVIPFFTPAAGDSRWQSMWRGFVMGAACSLLFMLIFGLIRNILALKSEKALKKLYVKCKDERAIQVWTSARAAAFQTILLLGIVAVVVAGYFSIVVSLTILGCTWFSAVISLGFKVYYSRKY